MNAPTLDHAPAIGAQEAVIVPEWRRLRLPLGVGLVLLGALFYQEVVAAVRAWNASTAYNHCVLIIPIVLYLLWDRRLDLIGIQPRPMPAAILLGLPLALVWLFAERLGIMEGRQLVALSFVELLFLAVLGMRLWRAMAGPLLYLFFLVPFGEFLIPRLQDIITWFIRHGLQILGIPAYIDGYVIEIPQGTFLVAEACAGLRFLIASIAFGCLYALLMYRSPVRRGLFILVSIIVPVIANGLRGLGVVYLGYLLNSAQAAAADHIIYGWVFFSVIILVLIMLGLPFRQDGARPGPVAPPDLAASPPRSIRRTLAAALGVVVAAAISPAVATALTVATVARQVSEPAVIGVGPDCVVRAADPAVMALASARTQRVVCHGLAMDMSWKAFSPRITAAPLMAERRRLVARAETDGLRENWLDTAGGALRAWRIMTSDDPAYTIGVAIWVDGTPVRPGLAMRAQMAIDSLFGSAYAPIVVTVTPAVDWSGLNAIEQKNAMASIPAFLLSHGNLDQTVGALSKR